MTPFPAGGFDGTRGEGNEDSGGCLSVVMLPLLPPVDGRKERTDAIKMMQGDFK